MNWLKKFMYGRYGVDQLSNGLILVSILLLILNLFLKLPALRYLTSLLIFISYYRMFSKNINKRYQENMKFLNWWNPIKAKLNKNVYKLKSLKTHKFFKCPGCNRDIRVPRGKGRLIIRCPKCNESFEGRS